MRKIMLASMGAMSVLAAGMAAAQPRERIQAGSLTCDISGGIGLIIVSHQTLTCALRPSLPGPVEFYAGNLTKLGLDNGVTAAGVMGVGGLWPGQPAGRRSGGQVCRRQRRGDGRGWCGGGRRFVETDCVAGQIGLELRCAERKFISLTSRASSDSGDSAQTVTSPERMVCFARAGLFPDRARLLAHRGSGAPSGNHA